MDKDTQDRICSLLAEGKSLNSICKADDMPAESTVRARALDDADFRAKYTRAREIGYSRLADEIIEIADEECTMVLHSKHSPKPAENDEHEVEVVFDSTAVARNRLRVDSRKWMLSKMLPKVYGDKLELAGDPDRPLIQRIERAIVKPGQ